MSHKILDYVKNECCLYKHEYVLYITIIINLHDNADNAVKHDIHIQILKNNTI